jgi:hypothetical protein
MLLSCLISLAAPGGEVVFLAAPAESFAGASNAYL